MVLPHLLVALLPSFTVAVPTSEPVARASVLKRLVGDSAASQQPAASSSLPDPNQFRLDNGTKWTIEYVGDVGYIGSFATRNVTGDKCRTSRLGDKVFWNCGDMLCNQNADDCGFSMGAGLYGTESVMTMNTANLTDFRAADFVKPWSGDVPIQPPFEAWGMDTSNVAAINDTHGVAYAWEIWRNGPDKSYADRGNAVAAVTLGEIFPTATRIGPLLTTSDAIQLGLLAILRVDQYIYIYSEGGPAGFTVSRVAANDDVFDASKYETLRYNTTEWGNGIPHKNDTSFGMTTAQAGGKFTCAVYGSVLYNNYLHKYTMICGIFFGVINMYVSNTPWGPWSAEYSLLVGWTGYAPMTHPEYSPGGSHKQLYISQGPNTAFNMFKLTFYY